MLPKTVQQGFASAEHTGRKMSLFGEVLQPISIINVIRSYSLEKNI